MDKGVNHVGEQSLRCHHHWQWGRRGHHGEHLGHLLAERRHVGHRRIGLAVLAVVCIGAVIPLVAGITRNIKPGEEIITAVPQVVAVLLEHFNILEEIALDAMRFRDTTTNENYLLNLKKTALTDWAECVNVLELAKKMDLPPAMETYRKHLIDYSNHRLQQTLLLIKATEEQTDKYKESIDSVQQEINVVRGIIQQEKPSFQ